jgi:chromosome segregation ATPase
MIDSAWGAWLHPRRAAEELQSLRAAMAQMEADAEVAACEMARVAGALDESRGRQSELERISGELEREVERLRAANTDQEERLRAWEEAHEEMERVAAQLEKMVALRERMRQMRDDYERRIEKLERQLWSSHRGGLQYADPRDESPESQTSELCEDGESPFAPPQPINLMPPLRPDRPRITPAADDTDWLMPLPPD